MLDSGFNSVTALDSEPFSAHLSQETGSPRLKAVTGTFQEFDYLQEEYSLVTAQWALPFNPPDTFDEVWNKIKKSLKRSGIFTGQFLGVHDEWNVSGTQRTFHTKEQIEQLFSDSVKVL